MRRTTSQSERAEFERLRQGRPLLGFRASKNHLSVFPFSLAAVDAVRASVTGFDLSKGTVRFTVEHPIPDEALEALLHYRLREIEGR